MRKHALYQGGGFIDSMTLIPVYTYAFRDFKDDVSFTSCNYTQSSRNYYQPRNDTFVDYYGEVVAPVKDAIQKALNLSPDIMKQFTFPVASALSDLLVAENYEGINKRYPFSGDQWYYIRYMLLLVGTVPVHDIDR